VDESIVYGYNYTYYLAEYGDFSGISYTENPGYSEGSFVTIEYFKNDPAFSRIKGMKNDPNQNINLFLFLLVFLSQFFIMGLIPLLFKIFKGKKIFIH